VPPKTAQIENVSVSSFIAFLEMQIEVNYGSMFAVKKASNPPTIVSSVRYVLLLKAY
jgi:hypothetical protein